jgi:hypothetical protein
MRAAGSRVTINPSIFLAVCVYRSIAIVSLPTRARRVVLVTGTGVGIAVEPEHPAMNESAASPTATTGRAVAANMVFSGGVRMATVW